jgi:hypothetical protein
MGFYELFSMVTCRMPSAAAHMAAVENSSANVKIMMIPAMLFRLKLFLCIIFSPMAG